jgi:hypothetical protein
LLGHGLVEVLLTDGPYIVVVDHGDGVQAAVIPAYELAAGELSARPAHRDFLP